MAKRSVIEVVCDRCGKTETHATDTALDFPCELSIQFHDNDTKFLDLCKRCRSACANYYKQIARKGEGHEEPEPAIAPDEPAVPKGVLGAFMKKG